MSSPETNPESNAKKKLDLFHGGYNPDLEGYVVTDKNTGREINVQFETYRHGYGDWAAQLGTGRPGDENNAGWTEKEQAEVIAWLNTQYGIPSVVEAVSTIFRLETDFYKKLPESGAEIILYARELEENRL